MYPDTDLPPKRITHERLDAIRTTLPQHIWEREAWYNTLGIPRDVILPLAISPFAPLFEIAVREWKLTPLVVSVALVQWLKRLKRKSGTTAPLDADALRVILKAHSDKSIVREGIFVAMVHTLEAKRFSSEFLPPVCSDKELGEVVTMCEAVLKTTALRIPEKRTEVLMGMVMDKLRGRIDGSRVAQKIGFVAQ
jgi:glutamyl-tRNA(Gln) amidotransferase subunit E